MRSRSPWSLVIIVIAAGVSVAGCVGAGIEEGPGDDWVPELGSRAVKYTCPRGETAIRGDGLCVGSLTSAIAGFAEPYAAIHPTDPDVFAIGVNEQRPVASWELDPVALTGAVVRFTVFVTSDGGASWQSTPLPRVDGAPPVGDPTLAFDADGRLHASGLAWDRQGIRVFYTRSDDGGRSWIPPVVVNDHARDDRPWLTVSPDGARIMISWQNTERTSTEVAMSGDTGRTWARAPSIPDCNLQTRVIAHGSADVLACFSKEMKLMSVWNVTDASTNLLSVVPGPPFLSGTIQLREGEDGGMSLGWPGTDVSAGLASSLDGGRSWTRPVDVLALVPEAKAWTWSWVSTFERDAWGNVHYVFVGGDGERCFHGGCADSALKRHIVHGAFTADGSRLLSSTRLVPEDAAARSRGEVNVASHARDDFHGLAFNGERGIIAWTFDKGIDYAFIVPE